MELNIICVSSSFIIIWKIKTSTEPKTKRDNLAASRQSLMLLLFVTLMTCLTRHLTTANGPHHNHHHIIMFKVLCFVSLFWPQLTVGQARPRVLELCQSKSTNLIIIFLLILVLLLVVVALVVQLQTYFFLFQKLNLLKLQLSLVHLNQYIIQINVCWLTKFCSMFLRGLMIMPIRW